MSRTFVVADRSTPFFLPPSVQEWLPKDHLARFVVEVVERLDLSPLERAYSGGGSKAYHPGMLLSMLIYGYATGVFSSRKLEAASYDSIAFRYICANTHPDHDTIATFRRRFLAELKSYFTQVLEVATELKMLSLGTVSLDGSKVKANASKHKALSWEYSEKLKARLEAEVAELLERAEQTDQKEDSVSVDLPQELARRKDMIAAIDQAQQKIKARSEARHKRDMEAYQEKMEARSQRETATGRKPGGRTPKPPEEGPRDRDQVNLTDEDSRIMPTSGGSFEQAYNAQAAVDTTSLLVVGQSVTQDCNDKQQITPALEGLATLPEGLGKTTHLLADTGYMSETNVEAVTKAGIEPLLATRREAHHRTVKDQLQEPAPPEADDSALAWMKYRLRTAEGRALYGRRKCTVEPVFGQIKRAMGFRQFSLRGLEKVAGEWTLVTIAYNMRRMNQLRTQIAVS